MRDFSKSAVYIAIILMIISLLSLLNFVTGAVFSTDVQVFCMFGVVFEVLISLVLAVVSFFENKSAAVLIILLNVLIVLLCMLVLEFGSMLFD